MAWNSNLDPKLPAYQIAADNSRYIRVLAGPGTGKSFALKRRVARILEGGIAPTRILPVTFTKVAAEDLQRELINMEVRGCEQIRGSTLHSLGMRVLSRQNVLAVTERVARPLNRFEMEPLLYDLPTGFGKKRERQKRIRAYEAAWARLQHEEPGFAQGAADAAFQNVLVAWLRFHEGSRARCGSCNIRMWPTRRRRSPPSWTTRSTNTDGVRGRFSSWPSGALSAIRSTRR